MNEIQRKLKRLRSIMNEKNISTLHLKTLDWFSWATGGGSDFVLLAAETGIADLIITQDKAFVAASVIEAQRLTDEELTPDFEIVSYPWQDRNFISEFVNRVAGNKSVACDRPTAGQSSLSPEFYFMRWTLEPEDITRYRRLAVDSAEAMSEVMRRAEPQWTEYELAAEGAKALWRRGIEPALILAAGEERVRTYRHPIPTQKVLNGRAMLVFCARRGGLFANLTRFVSFRKPTAEELSSYECVVDVEAQVFAASQPGKSLGEIYNAAAVAYASRNRPEQIEKHHQGGPTGYLSREAVAGPHMTAKIASQQALAWNPSVVGMKIEDTVLVQENGLEILTVDPGWPTFEYAGRARPQVLVKS